MVKVKDGQHALDLWETLCDTGDEVANQPLLILPDSYTFSGSESEALLELARIFWANVYVRTLLTRLLKMGLKRVLNK